MWVPLNSCLLDYDPQPRPSVSPVLYKQQASRLVFKRRLYQDLSSEDQLAQQLLYYQTLVSICDEGLPLANEKQLLKVLAMHRILDDKLKPPPIGQANMLAANAVKNILPYSAESGYNEKKKEVMAEKILKMKAELLARDKSKRLSFNDVIDEVRDMPLFGCVYFNVRPVIEDKKLEQATPKGLHMGISSQGVFLVFGKEKRIHDSYPFYRILGYEIKDMDVLVLRVRDAKAKWKHAEFRFKTAEAEEIADLVSTIMQDISSAIVDTEF